MSEPLDRRLMAPAPYVAPMGLIHSLHPAPTKMPRLRRWIVIGGTVLPPFSIDSAIQSIMAPTCVGVTRWSLIMVRS